MKHDKWHKMPRWARDAWVAARERPIEPEKYGIGHPDRLPDGLGCRVHIWQSNYGIDVFEGFCPTITAGRMQLGVFDLAGGELRPRYLDPREVELILGVREDWTLAPLLDKRGQPTDEWTNPTQRHDLLGNGYSLHVINPLLERIQEVIDDAAGRYIWPTTMLGHSSKSEKSLAKGFLSGVLFLASGKRSGYQVCPGASPGCRAICLGHTGCWLKNRLHQRVQMIRTKMLHEAPDEFMHILNRDLDLLAKTASSRGLRPACRLNGSSDLDWINVIAAHPEIQFYDYTKCVDRMLALLAGELPPNYHLTLSRSETNWQHCKRVLETGGNVAVVFRNEMPAEWMGYCVIDGTDDDLRFLDPPGVIVGLIANGTARRDQTGFVVDINMN